MENEIKLTESELVQVFEKWYSEWGGCKDDFVGYENPADAAQTFKDYLANIRETN